MLKWDRCWISSFAEGRHRDGRRCGDIVARVVALRQISDIPVMPHPSGRQRRLYLAMANRGKGWEAVGIFGTANKAIREAEWSLREVAQ